VNTINVLLDWLATGRLLSLLDWVMVAAEHKHNGTRMTRIKRINTDQEQNQPGRPRQSVNFILMHINFF